MSTTNPGVGRTILTGAAAAFLAVVSGVAIIPVKMYLFDSTVLPDPAFTLTQFAIVATFFLWPPTAVVAVVVLLLIRRVHSEGRRQAAVRFGLYLGLVALPIPWVFLLGATPLEAAFWSIAGAVIGAVVGALAAGRLEPASNEGTQD